MKTFVTFLIEDETVVPSEIRVFQKRKHCWPEVIHKYRNKIQQGETLKPITVKKSDHPNYNFDLVDGHHRYYASKDEGKLIKARIVK
jgi:hypothetical protein